MSFPQTVPSNPITMGQHNYKVEAWATFCFWSQISYVSYQRIHQTISSARRTFSILYTGWIFQRHCGRRRTGESARVVRRLILTTAKESEYLSSSASNWRTSWPYSTPTETLSTRSSFVGLILHADPNSHQWQRLLVMARDRLAEVQSLSIDACYGSHPNTVVLNLLFHSHIAREILFEAPDGHLSSEGQILGNDRTLFDRLVQMLRENEADPHRIYDEWLDRYEFGVALYASDSDY